MKDFAMQLTQKCVSMGLLDESYSEWFAYSIEKRVTTLFAWLVQCLIGGFCFGWTLTISFSVFFLLIRKYTNGYHAATYSKCLFCSILLEVVLLASISYVFRTGLALLFLTIVSDITILYIAPVNNKSIHWSTNEFIFVEHTVLPFDWVGTFIVKDLNRMLYSFLQIWGREFSPHPNIYYRTRIIPAIL